MEDIRPIDWRSLRSLHDVCSALLQPAEIEAAFAELRRTEKLREEQAARPGYRVFDEPQIQVESVDDDWHTQLVIAVRALAACMNCTERLPAASHDTWNSAWIRTPEELRVLPYARSMVQSAARFLKAYDATPQVPGQAPAVDTTPTA